MRSRSEELSDFIELHEPIACHSQDLQDALKELTYKRKYYLPQAADNPLMRLSPTLSAGVYGELYSTSAMVACETIDVDWTMKTMDTLWNATLYNFIRDEKNCEAVSKYLEPIVKEYEFHQIVQALTWTLRGWGPEYVSRFFRYCFNDWYPDIAGKIFGALMREFEFESSTTLTCALTLLRVPADMAAQFVTAMSTDWSDEKTTELISCLDCVLEWPESYFQEFTIEMMNAMAQDASHEVNSQRCELMLRKLTMMYESNLAESKLRLAMADFRLTINQSSKLSMSALSDVPESPVSE